MGSELGATPACAADLRCPLVIPQPLSGLPLSRPWQVPRPGPGRKRACRRDPAQHPQRVHVAFEEGFLAPTEANTRWTCPNTTGGRRTGSRSPACRRAARPRRRSRPPPPLRADGSAGRIALQLPHHQAGPVIPTDRRVQLGLRHLRQDQDLSPATPRCCPGKPPTAFKTREHHPTVETGASQTRVQPPSRLGFWLNFCDAAPLSDG